MSAAFRRLVVAAFLASTLLSVCAWEIFFDTSQNCYFNSDVEVGSTTYIYKPNPDGPVKDKNQSGCIPIGTTDDSVLCNKRVVLEDVPTWANWHLPKTAIDPCTRVTPHGLGNKVVQIHSVLVPPGIQCNISTMETCDHEHVIKVETSFPYTEPCYPFQFLVRAGDALKWFSCRDV